MNASASMMCAICGKAPVAAYNRPRSLHKTKRVVYPNLVSVNGVKVCTRCLKTLRRQPLPVEAAVEPTTEQTA